MLFVRRGWQCKRSPERVCRARDSVCRAKPTP
jgi:hypothetical protein